MSSSGSPSMRHGQKLYQQGDFKAAADVFTEALNRSPDPVTVLDSRAATYTKLVQYDLALRDARHMIKRDKNDERGYLRCAKALLLEGKPDKALEVYAYGLKTLSGSHPRRELVEQLHNKLRDKMSAKCIDPFSVLPFEVATMVLQHFDFREIVAILRVSKKWEQFLSSMRSVWMHLDFSRARGKVYWTSVRASIRRSKAMLTGALIANMATPSTPKALQLLSRCPNLEYLELQSPFAGPDFYDLFKDSKRLRTLITSADVYVPEGYTPISDYSLSNLGELRLYWAKANGRLLFSPRRKVIPRLRRLDISGVVLKDADLPPSLEYLRIHESSFVGGPFLDEDAIYLPRLASLVLSDARFITFETLELLLGTNEVPLRVLHVDCCFGLNGPALVRFNARTSKLDSLEEFNVSNVLQINDRVVGAFTSRMTELKTLNVSYTMVTGCTIKNLADSRSSPDPNVIKVARIYAKGCEELSSDAVAYGRARGIEILT
ncbi:hypothetical protein PHISP_01783 [Aspergillus sp. HF37]|nr:hypothetical protein PHISP_01783 [Aspergillus sp. HF37]